MTLLNRQKMNLQVSNDSLWLKRGSTVNTRMMYTSDSLPIQFIDADESIRKTIIEIGTAIYFNGLKWVCQEQSNVELQSLREKHSDSERKFIELREEYKMQVNDIRLGMERAVTFANEQGAVHIEQAKQSTARNFENIITALERQLSDNREIHNKSMTDTKEQYENITSNLKDQIQQSSIRIRQLEVENASALDISSKLDSLVGKKSCVDNAAKGDFGETVVHNQIMHYFPHSIIEDTSGYTARADMLWKLHNDSFRALVEVKNVQNVRASDLSKFVRDIQVNTNDGTCNCGLFVSLKTEYIPGKGQFHFEIINDVPVIYVSNVFTEQLSLRLALYILHNVQRTMKPACEDEDTSTHKDHDRICSLVECTYHRLTGTLKSISQLRQSIEGMKSIIANEERGLMETVKQIDLIRQDSGWVQHQHTDFIQSDSKRQRIIEAMKEFRIENSRWPTTAELVSKYDDIKKNHFRGELTMNSLRSQLENNAIEKNNS